MTSPVNRRHALQDFRALGVAGCASAPTRSQSNAGIAALYAGQVNGRGFMQGGYEGLLQARVSLGVSTRCIKGIEPKKELLAAGLSQRAQAAPAW